MKVLQAVFDAFWGTLGRPRHRATEEPTTSSALDLFVTRHGEDELLVGTLTHVGDKFIFRYSDQFRDQDLIPPIPEFPDKRREHRSDWLWPFFEVRLPPLDRSDVKELLLSRNLDKRDTLRLLAELGRKSMTTPYEFKLHDPSVASS